MRQTEETYTCFTIISDEPRIAITEISIDKVFTNTIARTVDPFAFIDICK